MIERFFAPPNTYPPCGMFTTAHIISMIVCFILITVAIIFTYKISDKALKKITRIFAYIFTLMEIIKIVYKFIIKDADYLDFWLPLSFCSLFIYALWMVGFGKGNVKKLGLAFIAGGAFTGGFTFIIMPATSLMANPLFHYLSIHSMLFHSCMVYMSLMYIIKGYFKPDLKNYRYYLSFVFSVCMLCIILNLIFDCNLMVVRAPINIPIKIVNIVASKLPWLYSICAVIIYCTVPYLVSKAIYMISSKANIIKREQK